MTAIQRVIKYLAIALAIFLIFSIVSVIAELGSGIFGFLLHKTNTTIVDTILITEPIVDIDIDLKYTSLDSLRFYFINSIKERDGKFKKFMKN